MNRAMCAVSGVLLMTSSTFAQAPGGGTPTGIAVGLQRAYGQMKTFLTQSAEKMPDAEYTFKPTNEIRTYGQLWGHVANAQFAQCSQAKGVPNPNQGTDLEQKTSKADFVKALADSFAFCDDVFASLTDETA